MSRLASVVTFILFLGLIDVDAWTKPDIDHEEIYRLVNNSCSPYSRRRRSTSDMPMSEIRYRSSLVLDNYRKVFAGHCNISTEVQPDVDLPSYIDEFSTQKDIKEYLVWMLWVKMAEEYMDEHESMRDPNFDITALNNLVNFVRQAVCIAQDESDSETSLPEPIHSTDPMDYRVPSCVALTKMAEFSYAASPTSAPATRPRRLGRRRNGKRSVPSDGVLLRKLKPAYN